jgi:hypothetical protein
MSINEFLMKPTRLPRKHLSDRANAIEPYPRRIEHQCSSEPRVKISLIKINKNKLPLDFFPKKDLSARKHAQNKLLFQQEAHEQVNEPKRADSDRMHYSP